jgi:hypothetical protein
MASTQYQAWYEKFASTGDICPLRLGMPREELRALFGEPDNDGAMSRKRRKPGVWVYGGLEFHFGHTAGDVMNFRALRALRR